MLARGAEPSARSAGCSEAEAQQARELKEAAPPATQGDHCALSGEAGESLLLRHERKHRMVLFFVA